MSALPNQWIKKESKSHPGKMYYFNTATGQTTWEPPEGFEAAAPVGEVRVRHLLKKHNQSRRPASWRNPSITQDKTESIRQITAYRNTLIETLESGGFDAMHQMFQQIAFGESDCGSHERGGDLGFFGPGKMQRPFEEASFALEVGQLSDIVDTDSGIHIILRIA